MNKPRPEAILGENANAWQHFNNLPNVCEPSANPNKRNTVALHGDSALAQTAQTIASIGAIWNSRQPKRLADNNNLELKYVITAQEIRNRRLAGQLGNELEASRNGERTAIEHASQTKKSIWQDIAEIAHDDLELNKYRRTLNANNPELYKHLEYRLERIETLGESDSITMSLEKRKGKRKTDLGIIEIAQMLEMLDTVNETIKKKQGKEAKRKLTKQKPNKTTGKNIWQELKPKIHKLDQTHKGKQKPKRIADSIGKNPSRIANYYTDPMRRVFTRKQRTTGALIIIDTSGSMNFDGSQLNQLMEASKGATVVTYSEKGEYNCHLVADQGKRVKELPKTGGNNGVDVPAIKWAIKHYHRNKKQQIVLISDGYATGKGSGSAEECRKELAETIKKHKIHMDCNMTNSIEKLSKLGKTKLSCNPESVPQ